MSGAGGAWDFVVRRHGEPGVEAACLALQDAHGQCVALLLWRVWTLAAGLDVTSTHLERAIDIARTWEAEAIAPLRAIRRRLTRPLPAMDEAQRRRLRQGLLEQELAMERSLVEALAALVRGPPTTARQDTAGAAATSVRAIAQTARLWGGGAPDDLLAKLAGA